MIKINLLQAGPSSSFATTDNKEVSFKDKMGAFFKNLKTKSDDSTVDTEVYFEQSVSPVELLIKLALIFSGITGLYLYEKERIPALTAKLKNQKQTLKQLIEFNNQQEDIVAEIEKMKENKKSFEIQIQSVGKLSLSRLKYVKALDVLQQNIPEKMWFSSLKTDQNSFLLSGVAFTEKELSEYIDAVSKNVNYKDVVLLESTDDQRVDSKGNNLRKFKIQAKLEAH